MVALAQRCNGFRIRGLNSDCDRLAVQSSEQTTWLLGRKRGGLGRPQWREVAIGQNELIVLRPYGGCPEFEIEALGDSAGILNVNAVRSFERHLRAGSKMVVTLGRDEACVIRSEWISHPRHAGVAPGAYGPGLQI